jgi:crotonobetainyl-CoA:carnitine CoA-transferase CaiB-like acyl-CoA transferase
MEANQVLDGIRVVDFSNVRSGAQISQILADFGADVVHVETPGGSALRHEAAWPFWARGKRNVELDLKAPADLDVARKLAGRADVVIETFRPGVADRLGIGYDALVKTNPRLVYASVSGFGRNSPYAQVQGYEAVVLAKLGVPWMLTDMVARPGPAFPAAAYSSYPATQLALQGILAALYEREDSGLGQRIETTLVQGQTVYDTFNWFARLLAQRFNESFKQVTRTEGGVPVGGLAYRLMVALTKDGRWLQFSQTTPRLFHAMMKMFELDWMFDDPKWKSAPEFDDHETRREFWELLLGKVRAKTAVEWLEAFDTNPNVWGEMYRNDAELLDHPQMLWNDMVAERDDPLLGKIRSPGPIAHLRATPANVGRPAPAPREHDAAVRSEAESQATPSKMPVAEPRGAPLAGITVIELGTYYAAPFAATLLAELGARVIKLEELAGDPHRHMLPMPEVAGIKVLQGKESIAVDLGTAEGRDVAHAIIAKADVVLQSFRGGVAEKLGLDPVTIRALNPDIIYLSAPGYGVDGPYARRPAFAPTIGAAVGFAHRNAAATIPAHAGLTLEEVKPASLQMFCAGASGGNADGMSAVTAATAMLLGLLARKRGMGGQDMFTSMLSSAAHALSEVLVTYEGAPTVAAPDPGCYGLHALYRLYQAGDGKWLFLAAPTDRDWGRLTAALKGGGDLATDPRFAGAQARAEHDDALVATLAAHFATKGAQAWEDTLLPHGVACVAVWDGPVEANFIDEGSFGRASGFVTQGHHPFLDEVPRLAPLVAFSRSATIAGNAGLLGQETDILLREFGFGQEAIAALHAAGRVVQG